MHKHVHNYTVQSKQKNNSHEQCSTTYIDNYYITHAVCTLCLCQIKQYILVR